MIFLRDSEKQKNMKANIFLMSGAMAIALFSSCNGSSDNTTTKTDTVIMGKDTGNTATETTTTTTTTKTVKLNPTASYVDIKGKSVKLRVDTVTRYVVNEVTSQPVTFYINPSTRDTFDRMGRLVSGALVKGSNGDYSIDESRLTVRSDDMNSTNTGNTNTGNTNAMVSGDTATITSDGTNANEKTKIKMKDGKVKIKTKPN